MGCYKEDLTITATSNEKTSNNCETIEELLEAADKEAYQNIQNDEAQAIVISQQEQESADDIIMRIEQEVDQELDREECLSCPMNHDDMMSYKQATDRAYFKEPYQFAHLKCATTGCKHPFLPTNDFPVWICTEVDNIKTDFNCSHALCGRCFGEKTWPNTSTANRRRGRHTR